jgi:multiple sugar transport system ATP-binding protein
MADLTLSAVNKHFGKEQVLHDINLDIQHREFVVIVGPSGCGKSTLLRVIAGLENLSSGEIRVDNENVQHLRASRRGLAMVFQNYALYPQKTVAKNMGFALKMAKMPKAEIAKRVNNAARILQIEELLERKPSQLSGGQRQRVAIGRAIVREPNIFLFDEPLSNLDAALRVDMRVELAKLHNSLDATMIYVTHDQTEAMTMADKIVVLRAGKIEQIGSPMDLYHHPINKFVAGFIGSPKINFLTGTVNRVDEQHLTISTLDAVQLDIPAASTNVTIGDTITLGIRPEHISIGNSNTQNVLSLEIFVKETLGGETILYGRDRDDQTLVLKVPGDIAMPTGTTIHVGINPNACYIFDQSGTALHRLHQ